MKKSIKQMLDLLNAAEPEKAPESSEPVKAGPSAAERLGSALLKSLGGVEGVSEDELVDALLGEWGGRSFKPDLPAEDGDARSLAGGGEEEDPFGESFRTPVPMKADSAKSEPMDYSQMSSEQFSRLKKLLKKATADGKRIRI